MWRRPGVTTCCAFDILSDLGGPTQIGCFGPGHVLAGQGSSRSAKAVGFGRRRHQKKEPGLQPESVLSAVEDDRSPSERYHWGHRPQCVRALGRIRPAGTGRPVSGLVSNTGALPCNHRSSCRAISTAACLRNAHSHTIATRQPVSSSSRLLRRSRSVFASNLARQNVSRVLGMVVYGQPACRCQKQPCTKHTALNRRNTRSGVPGSFLSCKRNRSPQLWMAWRRTTSGRVSLLLIPAIMRVRVALFTMSAILHRTPEDSRCRQNTPNASDVIQLVGMLRRGTEPIGSVNLGRAHAPAAMRNAGRFSANSPFECGP